MIQEIHAVHSAKPCTAVSRSVRDILSTRAVWALSEQAMMMLYNGSVPW